MPGFISQPLFESGHKTFSNAIGLRPMVSNQNVNDLPTLSQLVKNVGREMSAPIRDQKAVTNYLKPQQPSQPLG